MFDVDNKIEQIKDDEAKTLAPNFWDDQLKAQALMKEIKQNKNWVTLFKNIEKKYDDLNVLREFQEIGEASDEEIDTQYQLIIDELDENEFKSTLKNEEDNLSAIIEINAGAGGTEACDWAAMLMRMYTMWANKNGYK
ncbi:MAG: PCRF domain-containing protein, partial [Chitinophagales bacterium]|nr:PCRF domain-containing protein [Chitinophagales bacterium]